jgi:hypothetical protein
MYDGQLERKAGFFRAEQWRLVPVGDAHINNAIGIVERAVAIDPDNCAFPDLASLKAYLMEPQRSAKDQD